MIAKNLRAYHDINAMMYDVIKIDLNDKLAWLIPAPIYKDEYDEYELEDEIIVAPFRDLKFCEPTGKRDKRRKPIYEGDIVRVTKGNRIIGVGIIAKTETRDNKTQFIVTGDINKSLHKLISDNYKIEILGTKFLHNLDQFTHVKDSRDPYTRCIRSDVPRPICVMYANLRTNPEFTEFKMDFTSYYLEIMYGTEFMISIAYEEEYDSFYYETNIEGEISNGNADIMIKFGKIISLIGQYTEAYCGGILYSDSDNE